MHGGSREDVLNSGAPSRAGGVRHNKTSSLRSVGGEGREKPGFNRGHHVSARLTWPASIVYHSFYTSMADAADADSFGDRSCGKFFTTGV